MTLKELRLHAIINRIKAAIRQGECDLEELQDMGGVELAEEMEKLRVMLDRKGDEECTQ